jgi:DNA polymerase elongation subunit (family B)
MPKYFRVVSLDIIEKPHSSCVVRVFLRCEDKSGWCLDLTGFRPHMHLDKPNGDTEEFIEHLKEKTHLMDIDYDVVEKQTLYGYQGDKTKELLKLSFNNDIDRKKAKKLWFPYEENPKPRTPTYMYENQKLRSYEANVAAIIQFLHISQIPPSGIVSIETERLGRRVTGNDAMRNHHYKCSWRLVTPALDREACSIPLLVDSFDIEASSSHGDFPMAIKNYSLTAREIMQKCSQSKREDWDIGGWVRAALNIGKPVVGISQVELKKVNEAYAEECIQTLLESKADTKPKENDIRNYFNYIRDDENSGSDDEDDSSGYSKRVEIRENGPIGIITASEVSYKDRQNLLCDMFTQYLPQQKGDLVTYIGVVAGSTDPSEERREICFCLPEVSPKNARCELIQCSSEADLLLKYRDWWRERQPDIVIGYNIFGFDYPFLSDRAKELGIQREFLSLTPNPSIVCGEKEKFKSTFKIHETTITLASGQHCLRQVRVPGTVNIDLYNQFRKDLSLESYSLNFVAASLLGGKVKTVKAEVSTIVILDDTQGVVEGGMIALMDANGDPDRRVVRSVRGKEVEVEGSPNLDWKKWGFAKDDVSPQDIFRMSSSGIPEEATIVANYCKQDCALVYGLFDKVDSYTALTEMSNISCVPLEFLILRGQGIKLTSLLVKACNDDGRAMEDISRVHPDEPYEGAVVLEPHSGIYRDPVTVLDYSSLYPSADISDNISHETIKWWIQYDTEGKEVKRSGDFSSYLADGHHIIEHTIPTYKRVRVPKKTGGFKKVRLPSGTKRIGVVQYAHGENGLMPRVLKSLLKQRKTTRKRGKHKRIVTKDGQVYDGAVAEDEKGEMVKNDDGMIEVHQDGGVVACVDPDDIERVEWRFSDFIRNILDKRQLTYKILANSLYGGTGATTSQFYEPDVAALITSVGRSLLNFAKNVMEGIYDGRRVIVDGEPYIATAKCVYGDTDSVFVAWKIFAADGHSKLEEGTKVSGKDALPLAIDISYQAERLASNCLRPPHTLEYEKTFLPWLLITRKRYAGDLVEKATDKPKLKSMGVILRRKDNAPIARVCYQEVLDNILHKDTPYAFKCCMDMFKRVQKGKVKHADLIISKSLSASYANPERIAHKMLADRIAARDPGNAPRPGDRIPYVFIKTKDPDAAQKDRIELPEVAGENIDYEYYIHRQMLVPVAQLMAMELETIPGSIKKCKTALRKKGATLSMKSKALEKMIKDMLAPVGQKSVMDFF